MYKFFLKNKIIAWFFIVVLSINIFFAGIFILLDVETWKSWLNLIVGILLLAFYIQNIRNEKEY